MSGPLSGTGRLADDLYLVAHHEITGRPHLQPRPLGLGLAGGLLGELMLTRAIGLSGGRVMIGSGIPPGDELARQVVTLIGGERGDLVARDWLLFLARTAAAEVARRLAQAGYLTRARFTLITPSGTAPVRLQVRGEHYVSNALATAAVARALGMDTATTAAALS